MNARLVDSGLKVFGYLVVFASKGEVAPGEMCSKLIAECAKIMPISMATSEHVGPMTPTIRWFGMLNIFLIRLPTACGMILHPESPVSNRIL